MYFNPLPRTRALHETWKMILHTHTPPTSYVEVNYPHLCVRLRLDWEVLAISIVAKYGETDISQPAIGNKWPRTISRLLLPFSDRPECPSLMPCVQVLQFKLPLHTYQKSSLMFVPDSYADSRFSYRTGRIQMNGAVCTLRHFAFKILGNHNFFIYTCVIISQPPLYFYRLCTTRRADIVNVVTLPSLFSSVQVL